MEQFKNWEDFWQAWHKKDVQTEEDLYYQVAKTINKEPIRKEIFDLINQSIVEILGLNEKETLVEFCCGNGLCTYEFSKVAGRVIAVDYSQHLLETAKKHKSAPNITYCFSSVIEFLDGFGTNWDTVPHKFLMNDSLAYFTPEDLATILAGIKNVSAGQFAFLVRGVPNDELKWNFYNTEERRQKYENGVAAGDFTNAGMGRWWKPAEIEEAARSLGLKCQIRNQIAPVSNYRMDALISVDGR